MKFEKIIYKLAGLNLIRRYREYNNLIKQLKDNNTTDIAKFMKLSTNQKFMVLFSHVTATKIKQDVQMKLLYMILTVLIGSTGGIAYVAIG
jgi:hypothetical protein